MKNNFKIIFLISFCSFLVFSMIAWGNQTKSTDNWPERNISLIVPWSAGGSADLMSRILAPFWGEELGTTFVIENYPGAGGQVGFTKLANSKDESYTIAAIMQPHMSMTIALQGAKYSLEDFAFINIQQIDPVQITVLKDSKYQNLNDLANDIESNPDKIAIGTNQKSGAHAVLLFLKKELKLNFIIVPYSGGGKGRAALLGGHVDAYAGYVTSDYQLRDMARSLGVFNKDNSLSKDLWPEAKTAAEQLKDRGVKIPNMASYRGFVAQKSFKERYPDRWQKLVEAYDRAYHNEEHLEKNRKGGKENITNIMSPDEAEKLAIEVEFLIQKYKVYFEE